MSDHCSLLNHCSHASLLINSQHAEEATDMLLMVLNLGARPPRVVGLLLMLPQVEDAQRKAADDKERRETARSVPACRCCIKIL